MRRKIINVLTVLTLVISFFVVDNNSVIVANDKFKGKESEYLVKCAQRLNATQAAECAAFKTYYQSLGKAILAGSSDLKKEVESLKSNIEQLLVKSEQLTKEIESLKNQQVTINNNLKVTENNIKAIQNDIADLKLKIEKRKEDIKKRMRDSQLDVNGDRKFAFVLDAQDFDDLLRRISVLEQIARYDEERILLLRQDQEKLLDEERELNRQKEELISQKNEVIEKEKQIAVLKDANQVLVNQYRTKQNEIEAKIREAESNYATIMANASKINTTATPESINQISDSNKTISGFGPVMRGSWYRSAGTWYYPASFGGGVHLGLDMAGREGVGQQLLAPANSIVLMTKSGCPDYGSLGNRCGAPISSAGNWVALMTELKGTTYVFLYFHLANRGITTKDFVAKGEVIGLQGSSGSSTGPHLHLEIIKVGDFPIQQGYQMFKDRGYDPALKAGWGLQTRCEVKSPPCRLRPESFYSS